MSKLFISYKRHTEHDEPLATRLYTALSDAGHDVFLDQTMPVGAHWPKRIHEALAASDFLVLLISETSIESAMVAEEVRLSQQLQAAQQKPQILPVRVRYQGQLSYDLGAILNPLSYTEWQSEADDPRLISELLRAISGTIALPDTQQNWQPLPAEVPVPAANPLSVAHPLKAPEGTMMPTSPYYITRPADASTRHRLIAGGMLKEQNGRLVASNPLFAAYFQRVL